MTGRLCGEWNHKPGEMSAVWGCRNVAHFRVQSSSYFGDDAREASLWVCAECFDRMLAKGSVREI